MASLVEDPFQLCSMLENSTKPNVDLVDAAYKAVNLNVEEVRYIADMKQLGAVGNCDVTSFVTRRL